jgi:RND family efflux transporter MFP subunit
MTSQPIKTPSRSALWLAGCAGLAIAVTVAVHGFATRAKSAEELTRLTDEQAVPTVSLAKLDVVAKDANLTLPGKIQPFTRALINARVSGYLKSWSADIGASVKQGQTLATIDTPDLDQQLVQAKADLVTAKVNENLTALTAQRWRALLPTQSVTRQSVDDKDGAAASAKAAADAAQANVGRLEAMESFKTIVAPFDGIVTARKTDVGALINAGSGTGQELFELSDLHRVRIYVQVPQAYSAGLRPGAPATFRLPQYPGRQFKATLESASNALDPNSASMLVELQADNPDGLLAAGAYCEVTLELPSDGQVIRMPATALAAVDQGAAVMVLGDDGKALARKVVLGRDLGDEVEVLSGISASDLVIDNPPETLVDGESVRRSPQQPG